VTLDRDHERGEVAVADDAPELLLGDQHPRCGPAPPHFPLAPALDVAMEQLGRELEEEHFIAEQRVRERDGPATTPATTPQTAPVSTAVGREVPPQRIDAKDQKAALIRRLEKMVADAEPESRADPRRQKPDKYRQVPDAYGFAPS
jgi:hypothetical protein